MVNLKDRTRYLPGIILIGMLLCIRIGEFCLDYLWGDNNGVVTNPVLAVVFTFLYDILLVALLIWGLTRIFESIPFPYRKEIQTFWRTVHPTFMVLFIAFCAHGLIVYAYPAARGPDYLLYPGSAVELFQTPIRNPYILMDRNGYYPYLIWLFLQLPGQLITLVYAQHIACIALTVWTTRLVEKLFGKGAALLSGLAIALYPPLLLVPHITNSEAANLLALWPTALCAIALALNQHQGKQNSLWLVFGFGVSSGLAILARPSGIFLVFPLLLILWVVKIPRKYFVPIVLSMFLCVGSVLLYNALRLGYIGIEKKSGRILFQVAWIADKTYSPDNGQASLQLANLLREEWKQLLINNPVIRENNESIDAILAKPDELPYDLYYLIVTLTRKRYPPFKADQLLKESALEAIRTHFSLFVKNRLDRLRDSIFAVPRFQLNFSSSEEAPLEEENTSESDVHAERYRHAGVMYQEESYVQTRKQINAFNADYGQLQNHAPKRSSFGILLVRWWWKLFSWIRYIDMYIMIGLLFGLLWKDSSLFAVPRFNSIGFPLLGTILLACIMNRIFVYGISPGFRLHLLPFLPFELSMAAIGIWGLAKHLFSGKYA